MAYQVINIFPSGDAGHSKLVEASWADARDATDSDVVYTGNLIPVASHRTGGRGGTTYSNYRYYMQFDVSVIPYGSAIMNAKMYLWFDNSDGDMRLVSHAQTGTITGIATYNDCLYGGRSGTFMIPYADEFEDLVSIPATYTPIALNGTAIDNIQSKLSFRIALVTEKDFDNSAPSDTTSDDSDVYSDAYVGTSRDPYLRVEYENPSIFMGTNF